MKPNRDWLEDIVEAIEKIENRLTVERDAFDKDEMLQVWVVYHIQVIGEAASKLPNSIQEEYPDIPWHQVVAMRNILVHAYYEIDLNEIWATAKNSLPKLKESIKRIVG